ncbi:monofunctional biosynthetic peptidoglycan transglycosylase [Limnofasciculus baicalensis]|uniref:Monofunctional biosynthetic peptidoglycan transglycosylase n=1 Tax=Limnofasciculus baicalensis BBK-W-15 TaxID=2699891 RepID=A0AAE3GN75_9CYAN|nr:monofunctional biosynthetic peptidoglycan transglycosylase [Limnofasciculus baicalensis]MCP2727690.1 monofunctional biosynthetic peptidoglycan transglycosylase [Limnofasciculus baicalensis BBK-W-15]
MTVIPKKWMPTCSMKRVILHWTAGGYKASVIDKSHYHILIEDDGKLVKGTHSIKDNVSTEDNVYAAHTKGLNTGSIGISVCCMAEAIETPFEAGYFPMTKIQWDKMAQVVAELCYFYNIPVTPETVLGHGEVEAILGIPQTGKWDPMILPWNSDLSKTEVGKEFRDLVKQKISALSSDTNSISKMVILHLLLRIITYISIFAIFPACFFEYSNNIQAIIIKGLFLFHYSTLLPVLILSFYNPSTTSFILITQRILKTRGETSEIDRVWVNYKQMSENIRWAAVASEDWLFPQHFGFDLREILNCWRSNRAGNKVRGGSSITQQLAKNLFLSPSRTYFRKIIEAYLTLLLEGILTKRRILEIYLNIVQFDNRVFGVEAAANHFFNKPSKDLTLDESSLLITVLINPVKYKVNNPCELVLQRQKNIAETAIKLKKKYPKVSSKYAFLFD